MKEIWDSRYNATEYIYGTKPNEFLKSILDTHHPGSILLPGDGEGRNAVYAAKRGWQVTAFDYSTMAREKAEKLARTEQVQLNYLTSDVETFSTDERFNLISIIYLHLPPEIRTTVHKKLINYLKPGGKIVMECFSKKQLAYRTGGPKKINLLYSMKDLENDFSKLNIKQLKQQEIELNEGMLHQGKASVIRMIAEKN